MREEYFETLLPDVETILRDEEKLFIIKGSRKYPRKAYFPQMILSTFITIISSFLLYIFGILRVHEYNFDHRVIKVKTHITDYLLDPIFFLSLFLLIGLSILIYSTHKLTRTGDYFIATNNALIQYNQKNIKRYLWTSFSGTLKINKSGLDVGDLILELKTAQPDLTKSIKTYHIPEFIYISEVKGIKAVLDVLKDRIK